MDQQTARAVEHRKYVSAYSSGKYHMGVLRRIDAMRELDAVGCRGSYLDVSCGRAEMLDYAESLGCGMVVGTEVVPGLIEDRRVQYAEVHALPFADDAFQVVSMLDVIEHLLPGDDELACLELERVASDHILLTANNLPSFSINGDDLHINRRDYDEWHTLFCQWFDGTVTRLSAGDSASVGWRIDV